MAAPITCLSMNHINAVVDGYDKSVERFTDLYGAQVVMDMPRDEWHACLIVFGGAVIFELFAPHDDLLHARTGPHYVGIEYQVTDVDTAREAIIARGGRVLRELGVAFHAHPAECHGVAWEFYGQSFHAVPPPTGFLEPIRPVSYWADEHPLGSVGLKRYSLAVDDLDAARGFLEGVVNGTVAYEEDRPEVGARAVGVTLADTVVELLAPTADGVISRHVARWGDGIRSTVFQVKDLAAARTYFEGKGVELQPGDAPDTLAIGPEDNCGILFEFCE
jgi:catechol 2,3-dioxygenase-like lactoylglutathione lyase family enzyme